MPSAVENEKTLEKICQSVEEDIKNEKSRGDDIKEFPLTAMSRGVSEAIWRVDYAPVMPIDDAGRALDVGTGSGIHAFVMSKKGFSHVTAIDVNEKAIKLAHARAERLGFSASLATPTHGGNEPQILFMSSDLERIATLSAESYALIAFNPPAYYPIASVDFTSPVTRGVYVDGCEKYDDHKQSHLYRFFKHVVLKLVADGGHVICSWPGLERRVVEGNPDAIKPGSPVLPTILLRKWLNFEFVNDYRDLDQFYNQTATIRDYGLGRTFLRNLLTSIERGYYSRLLCPVDRQQHGDATFRFGILHLVCESRSKRCFRIADIAP